jgi:hypothetical protein
MITLKQFLEAGQYRITEGSDYGWQCYGDNSYTMDVQAGDWQSNSAHVVFDRVTQEVFQATCYDYKNERAYRIFGSDDARRMHTAECLVRKCDEREAWEDVNYVDLEVDEDFLEKMTAIMLEQEYDTMVSIPLDLGKEELHTLMLMAHEKNITLNEMVAEVLQAAIDHAKEIVGTDNGFQK